MIKPRESTVDRVMSSDFVETITMSFSLCPVVAEHSRKPISQPQQGLRPGADASAIHGRLGCSGCTPAEPDPPKRAHKLTPPADHANPKRWPLPRLCQTTPTKKIALYP